MSSFAPLTTLAYLLAGVCFILSLRSLASPVSARRGNIIGIVGMAIALITTIALVRIDGSPLLLSPLSLFYVVLAIALGGIVGAIIAHKIAITALPQLVAAFHSLVGLAAVLVASVALHSPESLGISLNPGSLTEMALGSIIGAFTFSGSIIAFGKLQGVISSKPFLFPMHYSLCLALSGLMVALMVLFGLGFELSLLFLGFTIIAMILGVLLIVPIGGADMPVVVSMLNSYSGWAACGIGFTISNPALVITGSLVGASGAILSYIMCKAMNRSFISVILGGFGGEVASSANDSTEIKDRQIARSGNADDAAFLLNNANEVIIVPGYGMAVAQAQHSLRAVGDMLKVKGVRVRYAIHPVAGRMPGHMNVLLAEADIPYDEVLELDEINRDFSATDVSLVIGANDITNPAAKDDPKSPIYGMPILDVERSNQVIFVKRSMSSGYAGVDNELFFRENTMMLFGDAKDACEGILRALEGI